MSTTRPPISPLSSRSYSAARALLLAPALSSGCTDLPPSGPWHSTAGDVAAGDDGGLPGPECDPGLAGPQCEFIVPDGYVWIPAGQFNMGSPATDWWQEEDEVEHPVTLTRSYLLKRTEVTQREWAALADGLNPAWPLCESCPVTAVDWSSAAAFANATSVAEGLQPCYVFPECEDSTLRWQEGSLGLCPPAVFVGPACDGYRLPTEAEWERAARAGSLWEWWSGLVGNGECDDAESARAAWYCGNSRGQPQVVGQMLSPWGLADMLGNVWEWTNDWYAPYPAEATDPLGPSLGTAKSVRGGGYGDAGRGIRAANRGLNEPSFRAVFVGFRLARWVE